MTIESEDNAAELDQLAGEYVLGTLPAAQRAEVIERLPHDRELRAAVDAWERRLLPLTQLAAPHTAPPALWARIERSLGQLGLRAPAVAPSSGSTRLWQHLAFWRSLAAAGLAASLVLAALLLLRPMPVATPSYLVVLVAPQDKAPGWVIQAGSRQEIELIPLATYEVPADKALEFWTKADGWQGPVSLGLVKPGETLRVPLDRLPPLVPNQLFELTLEGRGGSSIGKPTGPIQFIGRAVKVI